MRCLSQEQYELTPFLLHKLPEIFHELHFPKPPRCCLSVLMLAFKGQALVLTVLSSSLPTGLFQKWTLKVMRGGKQLLQLATLLPALPGTPNNVLCLQTEGPWVNNPSSQSTCSSYFPSSTGNTNKITYFGVSWWHVQTSQQNHKPAKRALY